MLNSYKSFFARAKKPRKKKLRKKNPHQQNKEVKRMNKAIIALLALLFVGTVFAQPMTSAATKPVSVTATSLVKEKPVPATAITAKPIAKAKAIGLTAKAVKTKAIPTTATADTHSLTSKLRYIPGDVNGDGKVDFNDIDYFRLVLQLPQFFEKYFPAMYHAADVNKDGLVNAADVDAFVALLSR